MWQWHLGYGQQSQLPSRRGFDSYLGYWNGAESYYNHTIGEATSNCTLGGTAPIYDFVDDKLGAANSTRTGYAWASDYSTHVFSRRAVDIITAAAAAKSRIPWFIYLAFQAVHWPLEAPAATVARFAHIPDTDRQLVAAMASEMDTGVGEILGNLTAAGERERTLVCFTSDKCALCVFAAVALGPIPARMHLTQRHRAGSGGPTNGFEGTQSNNFPLRGGKKTMVRLFTGCVLRIYHGCAVHLTRVSAPSVGGWDPRRRPRERFRHLRGNARQTELRAVLLCRLAAHAGWAGDGSERQRRCRDVASPDPWRRASVPARPRGWLGQLRYHLHAISIPIGILT